MKHAHLRTGFTLIELLVVIAIITILAGILVPSVHQALTRAAMIQAMSNGRSMHQALFAAQLQERHVYPQSQGDFTFTSSTPFFRWVVTNGVMDVDFSFFAARGVPAAHGLDPEAFLPEHNAWCITADVDRRTPAGTPLLFTRNLQLRHLDDGPGGALGDENPFGTFGAVIVYMGGHAASVPASNLAGELGVVSAANAVLRP